jgi:hypothetical protein
MNSSGNTILLRGSICFDKRPASFIKEIIPSIRKWFDGQLVVSTWKGQEQHLEGLQKDIDRVVLVDDPGPGFIQSYNRQLISYKEGLKACEGEMLLVSRSDIQFGSDPFTRWASVPQKNNGHFRVFQERVIVGNMMTIPPHRAEASVSNFRVSDWFQIGKKRDLELWADVLETSHDLYRQHTGLQDISTTEYKTETYGSEQVWLISLLHKHGIPTLNLANYSNFSSYDAWCALINNFWILNNRSTLNAHNLNWTAQPEFHPWYITEHECVDAYHQIYGDS